MLSGKKQRGIQSVEVSRNGRRRNRGGDGRYGITANAVAPGSPGGVGEPAYLEEGQPLAVARAEMKPGAGYVHWFYGNLHMLGLIRRDDC